LGGLELGRKECLLLPLVVRLGYGKGIAEVGKRGSSGFVRAAIGVSGSSGRYSDRRSEELGSKSVVVCSYKQRRCLMMSRFVSVEKFRAGVCYR
jgi:hypothetical protein